MDSSLLVKFLVPFVLFFVVAHPMMYRITRSVFGKWVADPAGFPTTAGVVLHAVVISVLLIVVLPLAGIKLVKSS